LLVVILVSLLPTPARADERLCAWDGDARAYVCKIVRRAEPGGPARSVDIDGEGPLPIVWSRILSNGLPGATFDCYYEALADGEVTEVHGVGWAVFFTNAATGETTLAGLVCEYPGEDPPQPPPPPPDVDWFVEDQRQVLALETGLSPSAERRGVSQLPTWFWCNGPQSTGLALSLDGYQIAAEVGIESVVWSIDGPDGVTERSAPGCGAEPAIDSSGEAAAATWTPNESGESVIVLTTTWSGTWELTYNDPTFGAVDLGAFDLGTLEVDSEPVLYEVYEIQTVGVGP
jgi:hypothetical protein